MISKESLLAELAQSRTAVLRDWQAVGDELNLPKKAGRLVQRHPLAWLGAAAAVGFLASGRKSPAVPRFAKASAKSPAPPRFGAVSILWGLAKILVPVLRPALSAYAAQKLGELASKVQR